MYTKVSLIVIIDNFNENFLKDCLNSLINQSLHEIEIICVSNLKIDIIDSFSKKDSRIKSIISESGNLKFDGLKNISGEYFSFINCNDWVDFDFCKLLYDSATENNSDIVLYKILKYNDGQWFEDYFYNFFNFGDNFLDKHFKIDDIFDIIFSIPHDLCNKFFKNNIQFDSNPFFIDNLIFEDSCFFLEMLFESNAISLLDNFIYFKRNYKTSNLIDGNILINVVDYVKKIQDIFRKYDFYNIYKKQLFNYIFDLVRYWFFSVVESVQRESISYIWNWLNLFNDEEFLLNPSNFLNKKNLFFYNNLLKYSNFDTLMMKYEVDKLNNVNEVLLGENAEFKWSNEVLLGENAELKESNSTLLIEIEKLNNHIININEMNAILKEKNIKFIDLLKKQNILIIKSDERIDFLNKKINVLEDNSSLDSKSLKYSFMNILK